MTPAASIAPAATFGCRGFLRGAIKAAVQEEFKAREA
jgi:hypothetical protein